MESGVTQGSLDQNHSAERLSSSGWLTSGSGDLVHSLSTNKTMEEIPDAVHVDNMYQSYHLMVVAFLLVVS